VSATPKVVAKAPKVKRQPRRKNRGRARNNGFNQERERCFEVAFPQLGIPQEVGITSRTPVVTLPAIDSQVIQTDSAGQACVFICPEFCGIATNATWKLSTDTLLNANMSFINLFGGLNSSGDIQAASTVTCYSDKLLTSNLSESNTTPFSRARLLSFAVEVLFVGDSLYDGGTCIIQGFDGFINNTGVYCEGPQYTAQFTQPLYDISPLRCNKIFSVPVVDRSNLDLISGASNAVLGGGYANPRMRWPVIALRISSTVVSKPIVRIIIRRMIQLEVAPNLLGSPWAMVAKRPPEPSEDETALLESFEASNETGIFSCPASENPLLCLAQAVGIPAGYQHRAANVARSFGRSLVGHMARSIGGRLFGGADSEGYHIL